MLKSLKAKGRRWSWNVWDMDLWCMRKVGLKGSLDSGEGMRVLVRVEWGKGAENWRKGQIGLAIPLMESGSKVLGYV